MMSQEDEQMQYDIARDALGLAGESTATVPVDCVLTGLLILRPDGTTETLALDEPLTVKAGGTISVVDLLTAFDERIDASMVAAVSMTATRQEPPAPP
jgi:hypothetical protein